MVSSPLRLAAFAGLALVSGTSVRGALGVAASGSANSQVIAPHDGGMAFNEQMSRAHVLSALETELLDVMMEDPGILDMVKGILKDALAGVVQTLSVTAKESCDKLAESAEDALDEADSVPHSEAISSPNGEDVEPAPSFVMEQVHAKIRSRLDDDGFFDDLKEKAKGAWREAKGAAKSMLTKLAQRLKPTLEKALAAILPRLRNEATKILAKACDIADQKLNAVHERLQQH